MPRIDTDVFHKVFPRKIAVVERSYEADRTVFIIMMTLISVVIVWIAVQLMEPLWDSHRVVYWGGFVQIAILVCVAYLIWAQYGVYHHDWPFA